MKGHSHLCTCQLCLKALPLRFTCAVKGQVTAIYLLGGAKKIHLLTGEVYICGNVPVTFPWLVSMGTPCRIMDDRGLVMTPAVVCQRASCVRADIIGISKHMRRAQLMAN